MLLHCLSNGTIFIVHSLLSDVSWLQLWHAFAYPFVAIGHCSVILSGLGSMKHLDEQIPSSIGLALSAVPSLMQWHHCTQ